MSDSDSAIETGGNPEQENRQKLQSVAGKM